MPTLVIELKLGSAISMPTHRLNALLTQTALDCDRARNAAVRFWERWREDNPDWKPEQRRTRDGSPKAHADGRPVLESEMISQAAEHEMYYAARRAATNVNASVITSCRGQVLDALKARTPYNHEGTAQFVWQAILANELARPCYRGGTIPVPNNTAGLVYSGAASKKASKAAIEAGQDQAILQFALLSKDSGYHCLSPIVRLHVRELSAGTRRILKAIAEGRDGYAFCDSSIVNKGKFWSFQLVAKVPTKDAGLTPSREAILFPQPGDQRRPFVLEMPDNGRRYIGNGDVLKRIRQQQVIRRKTLQARYREGVAPGHGKGRFFERLRPHSRQWPLVESMFTKMAVADIVKSCLRNDCGTVVYREPTMPVREHRRMWFAEHGIPFDWTRFEAQLIHACEKVGISVKVFGRKQKEMRADRINMAEWRERIGDASTAEENDAGSGNASLPDVRSGSAAGNGKAAGTGASRGKAVLR
jgi:hypothetical protein